MAGSEDLILRGFLNFFSRLSTLTALAVVAPVPAGLELTPWLADEPGLALIARDKMEGVRIVGC